jgi:energy-coupling factor transport system permease protein
VKGLLQYQPGDSFFHRLNPLTKLLLALLLCASCFVSDSILFILAIIALNLLIARLSGIFKLSLGLLKGLTKLSLILFIIQVLFVRTGNVLFTIPLINVPITDEGMRFSLLLVLRLAAATLPLAIMLSVTKMTDLSNVMVAKLRIPYKYAYSIITAIRFIPVFAGEMAEIIETSTARGVEFDTRNPFKKLRLIAPLCVPLLLSCVRKIDTGALAAELRGFNLRKSDSGYRSYSFRIQDAVTVIISVMIVVASAVLRGN